MFAAHDEKSFVPAFVRSLLITYFDNLELGKRNYCFEKRSGKSREFWVQKTVRTLVIVLLSSKLCNQRVTLVNTLIPLFWK